MRPNISITLTTPHVTIERYSELTGLSIDTINDMLADGRLSPPAVCVVVGTNTAHCFTAPITATIRLQ